MVNKSTARLWPITLCLGLVWLSGCASGPSPPPAPPAAPAAQIAPPAQAGTESTLDDKLRQAAAQTPAPFTGAGWQAIFDGKSLAGWQEVAFAGRGELQCQDGLIVLNMGSPFTGIRRTNDFPNVNYEIALDAMRAMGSDFFCGLTVPVGDSYCSLIVGGWGGSVVGISSLDGMDASENETTKFMNFENRRWYRIRLRVTERRIEAWIDQQKMVDVVTSGRKIALRAGEIEMCKPFGLAAWQATAGLREIKWRRVDGPADPEKKRD